MSSTEPVEKKSSFTWLGVVGATAGVIAAGYAIRNARIRKLESLDYAVGVAMKSLQKGCSFHIKSSTHVASTLGFVERPTQVYDFLYERSFGPVSSRPHIVWATSGTGKTEYDLSKLEERGSDYMHLVCKKDRLNENIVGKAVGINSKQYENSFDILEEALLNLKDDQERPRCLIILEDPKVDDVDKLQKIHEMNKGGLCDMVVVFSEKRHMRDIVEKMAGKQSRLMEVEYLPPSHDSFIKELKKSVVEGVCSFQEDDMMDLLDYVGLNFSDFDFGLDFLHRGYSINKAKLEIEKYFKKEVENCVHEGGTIEKDVLNNTLKAMFDNNGMLQEGDIYAISHFVKKNIFRTMNNHYTFSKKCMELGVAAYLESLDT